uniref:Thymopoietin a n=1 Tax=Denticeps clupeoides TaxID=299321 RepID=A0AAY4DKJ8_9TELE
MAEFLEDPSVLTKDKLKSELLANAVALPSGEHRKEVYVQLYLNHLTVLNQRGRPADTFSSDEEPPLPVPASRSRSGRKAARKTDKPPSELSVLTDEDLKEQLLKHGIAVGPVVSSTRKLYEKKLQKVLEDSADEVSLPPEPATLKADGNQNGNTHAVEDHFSDKEEEELGAAEAEPTPVVTTARSRGKIPVSTRTSSRNKARKQVADEPGGDDDDVLKEMFPNEAATPTGISATCRKPIHGAAGRPVRPLDLWPDECRPQHSITFETGSYAQSFSTPPARGGRRSRASRCLSAFARLLALLGAAAAAFYLYHNVDEERVNALRGLLDTHLAPLLSGGEGSTADGDK